MVSHFVPSVAYLGTSPKQQADELLQRTLFGEDEEDMIDAPLGETLFAHSPFAGSTPRGDSTRDGFDRADQDQWLDEVGRMKDELTVAQRTADAEVRRTERQAARLAEVMSRTADGRVAAARRWAAQEANKHQTLAYEEGLEWADMVSQIKVETADAREDLADARAEKARLAKKLADAALRFEREQRAVEKQLEEAVAARTEADAAASARQAAAEAADLRAERAEAQLASAAAEWSERLARAEAREHEAVEQRNKFHDRGAAEFGERIAAAMARAEQAELARRAAETQSLELESKWKEEELRRRVGREAAMLELSAAQGQLDEKNSLLKELSAQGQSLTLRAETAEADQVELRAELERMDAAMEEMTRRVEQQQQDQRAEVVGLLEQIESSARESETLGRLLGQRTAELQQLSAREALQYCVYRRTWIRMCCRLLIGSRSAVQLIFANQSLTDADTESESSGHTGFSPFRPRRVVAMSPARPATLGRNAVKRARASALSPVIPSDSGEEDDIELDAEAAGRDDMKSPELELEDLQDYGEDDGEDQGDGGLDDDGDDDDELEEEAEEEEEESQEEDDGFAAQAQPVAESIGAAKAWEAAEIALQREQQAQVQVRRVSARAEEIVSEEILMTESLLVETESESPSEEDGGHDDNYMLRDLQRAATLGDARAAAARAGRSDLERTAALGDARAATARADRADAMHEPGNMEEAERMQAWQQQRNRVVEHGDGTKAVFPMLEANPWLLALLPLLMLIMCVPIVIMMVPERGAAREALGLLPDEPLETGGAGASTPDL